MLYNLSVFKKGYSELKTVSHQVALMGGGNFCYCLYDIVKCLIRYGARPSDYLLFEFYNKSHHERNRYMTNIRWIKLYKAMIKSVGDQGIGNDKVREYGIFKDYIKRDWIVVRKDDTNNKVLDFINSHDCVIAKPAHGTLGWGLYKVTKNDRDKIEELLKERQTDDYIIEECVKNTTMLELLNPSSLNTLRIFTCKHDNRTEILEIILRVGLKGMHVDNWGQGGIIYRVDKEHGVVSQPGLDKKMNKYILHPDTNQIMAGYKLPDFEKLKDYVLQLADVLPEAKVVGWDIAITPQGFDFIEMNCPGGHDICQAFGTPYWDKFKQFV